MVQNALSRINGTGDDIVEIYMAIEEGSTEELVTKNVKEQTSEKQPNLPNFKENIRGRVNRTATPIKRITISPVSSILPTEPKQLLVLKDWQTVEPERNRKRAKRQQEGQPKS
ncbi:16257_t:CDS:2, partial [Cetraspora pellucida]